MHPLAPLAILLSVLIVFGFVGYIAYTIANDVAEKTSKKMQRKNVIVTKDGMKVGVREIKEERYVDQTQKYVLLSSYLSQAGGIWERFLESG